MESDIQKDCIAYLKDHPKYYGWRNNTGRRGGVSYGTKGASDWIGCYMGRFLGIEFKAPKKRRTEPQREWAVGVEGAGGKVIVARSLGDMIKQLTNFEGE